MNSQLGLAVTCSLGFCKGDYLHISHMCFFDDIAYANSGKVGRPKTGLITTV